VKKRLRCEWGVWTPQTSSGYATAGWAKKWRNFAYFQTRPANFPLSRPNAAAYCNSI